MTPVRRDAQRAASNSDPVIEAIAILDDKLTTQIAGVVAGLQQLTEAHHAAVLEQERRNATFATAVRLETLDNKLSAFMADSAGRIQRLTSLEAIVAEHGRALTALQTSAASRQIQGLSALAGWPIQALIVLSSTVLAFILYHAVFH